MEPPSISCRTRLCGTIEQADGSPSRRSRRSASRSSARSRRRSRPAQRGAGPRSSGRARWGPRAERGRSRLPGSDVPHDFPARSRAARGDVALQCIVVNVLQADDRLDAAVPAKRRRFSLCWTCARRAQRSARAHAGSSGSKRSRVPGRHRGAATSCVVRRFSRADPELAGVVKRLSRSNSVS